MNTTTRMRAFVLSRAKRENDEVEVGSEVEVEEKRKSIDRWLSSLHPLSPEQPGVVRQLLPLGQSQGLPLRGVQEGPRFGGGARLKEREHEGDEHCRDGDDYFKACHRISRFVFLSKKLEKILASPGAF